MVILISVPQQVCFYFFKIQMEEAAGETYGRRTLKRSPPMSVTEQICCKTEGNEGAVHMIVMMN